MPIPVWPCGDDYKKERKCRLEHRCSEKGRKCAGIVCSAWAHAETAAQVCERASPGRLSLWHIHGYYVGGTSGQEGKRRRRFPLILPILSAACSASQDPCALRHQVRKGRQCGRRRLGACSASAPGSPRGPPTVAAPTDLLWRHWPIFRLGCSLPFLSPGREPLLFTGLWPREHSVAWPLQCPRGLTAFPSQRRNLPPTVMQMRGGQE